MRVPLLALAIVAGSTALSICLLGCGDGTPCADSQENDSANVESATETASAEIGPPPVPALTTGQEFIYEGSLVTLQTPSRTKAHRLDVRTRVTTLSKSPLQTWNLAYATSTRSSHPQTFVGQSSLEALDYLSVTPFGEFRSGAPPLHDLGRFAIPPFISSKATLVEGQWQRLREIRLTPHRIAIAVTYAAGAQEEREGRTCCHIQVHHAGPLPKKYSALGFSEAEDPQEYEIEVFRGDIWFDASTRWLVRASYHVEATFSATGGVVDDHGLPVDSRGRATDPSKLTRRVESDYTLTLKDAVLIPESELTMRERQVKTIYELGRSFGHSYRNSAVDAELILKQLDVFDNDFPTSPYAEIAASFRTRAELAMSGKVAVPFDPPLGGPLAGKVAANFSWQTNDGRRMELSDFRGKPVVLLFFASRIATGQRAFRTLQTCNNEDRNKAVQIVAIKLHHRKPSLEVEDAASRDAVFPVIEDTVDISRKYNILSDVNVIVLDAQQRIQYFRTAFYPSELTELLGKLAAEVQP